MVIAAACGNAKKYGGCRLRQLEATMHVLAAAACGNDHKFMVTA
jgi:hypothetical protein